MIPQPHTSSREIIVAEAISTVVSELRMIEVADYIAFIRLEHYATLSDIVDTAAELHFMPRTIRLGNGAEADVGWDSAPRIRLDLELRPQGATVYFTLSMSDAQAGVEVNYVAFDRPDADPERNTAFLAEAIDQARIRKTVSARCQSVIS